MELHALAALASSKEHLVRSEGVAGSDLNEEWKGAKCSHKRVIACVRNAEQNGSQARSQTMNTVGTAAYSACSYTHIMLICCVYILCMHKRKERLCQDHKFNTLITQRTL